MLFPNAKQTWMMNDYTSIADEDLEACLIDSQLNAQLKKPHTIAESIVVSCFEEIVRVMLGENAAKEIQKNSTF